MKKNIFLILVTTLLSLGAAQAAQNFTKCYGQSQTMTASKTGKSYQWYKDGVKINGATNQTYTASNLTASAKYTCEVTPNENTIDTGNLITEGTFDKDCNNYPDRQKVQNIEYQMMNKACSNYPMSNFTTIAKDANDVKEPYFKHIKSVSGNNSNILVCDGAQSQGVKVWAARELKLKAGETYRFSCYVANIDSAYLTHGSSSLPNLEFRIEYDGCWDVGQLLSAFKAPEIKHKDDPAKWEFHSSTFTVPFNYDITAHIFIKNHNLLADGNDFAIDDIYFGTTLTTSGTPETEDFNVTVYDTFEYDFKTEEVCPGAQATITTTLVPAHGGTLEPAANYKYEWKLNGTTPVVSTNKNLVVTAPNTVGTESYVISTSSTVCYNSGAKSQTTSIKVEDNNCGTNTTARIDYDPCLGADITLTAQATGTYSWSTGETTQSINISSAEDKTITCTVTNTVGGVTNTVTESHIITTKDCSNKVETEMCNNSVNLTLETETTGNSYEWTLPDGTKPSNNQNTLTITPEGRSVGDVLTYTCVIKQNSVLIATENFEITITDCHKETDKEEEVQVKEDGSIKLVIPSENRCTDCIYNWYKKDENGKKGEPVVKNIGEEDWEHTVHNAKEEDYVCEIIKPNGNIHEQSYKVRVYVPKTSKYCYTKDSENEQYVTIDDLTVADRDEYEWYLIQGNDTIPMPEAAIVSTENQKITLDVDYFVNNNSKFPVTVHILEEFAHKLQVESTEIEGGNNSTDVTPEPEPTPETPIAPAAIPPIQINTSALSISSLNIINGGKSYSYKHTFEDASTSTVNIEIGQDYQYTEYFESKVGGMTEHAGVVRLTNTGINGCHAYKGDNPNNEYFFEVDGGDKAGPIFSIVQEGKIIKGKKYILRFLARETSTDPSISGPTTNPAKIDFKITLNGNTYGVTNQILINKQDWTAHVFNYIANEDADNVILTLSNYNTDSGHNDFAIDEITFALADPSIAPENRSLKFRNLADENEGIVDEDGDGFVMWKDEHILSIYPNSSQTLVEVSSPNKEHETEVNLPIGEKVKFTYYPSMYQEGMTQYTESATREDEHGCKHTVNFTLNLVELEPDLYFSPNDDGVHDKWMVKGIETAPNAHIMIYDRHSKLLYKTVASEFEGWDGTFEGHHMVQDDYWYVILIPETNETLSGHFTLKR